MELSQIKLPPIPIKERGSERKLTSDSAPNGEVKKWFYVKSPRETFGALGPVSVEELKLIYSEAIIRDDSLVFTDGNATWLPMKNIPELHEQVVAKDENKPKQSIPILPFLRDFKASGPVAMRSLASSFRFQADFCCVRCGHNALEYCTQIKDYPVELSGLRSIAGSTNQASEILPGFLWIGNSSTGKTK